jgi:hypothetical protein
MTTDNMPADLRAEIERADARLQSFIADDIRNVGPCTGIAMANALMVRAVQLLCVLEVPPDHIVGWLRAVADAVPPDGTEPVVLPTLISVVTQ